MREIKFRAWDGDNKIMEMNVSISNGKAAKEGYQWFSQGNTVLNSPVMQYTGLKDKNGKEIYEGDIIQTPYKTIGIDIGYMGDAEIDTGFYRGVVSYQASNGFMQKNVTMISDENELCIWQKRSNLPNIIQSRCEVIGNIYENPELLEVDK